MRSTASTAGRGWNERGIKMKPERKFIFGTILIIMGIVLLVIGLIQYVGIYGINAIFYIHRIHDYVFNYVMSYVLIIWGSALLISGFVFILLGFMKKEFSSKKPLAVGVSVLIIAMGITGFFIYSAVPPSIHADVSISSPSHYAEVGSSNSTDYKSSVYSNYYATEYFNISLKGKLIYDLNNSFHGYYNTTYMIPGNILNSPGNYSILVSVVHGTKRYEKSSWFYVYPLANMNITINGPKIIEPGIAGSYSVSVSGGYGPYNVSWIVFGNSTHHFYGKTLSYIFGEPYYGYSIIASVRDKYGDIENKSIAISENPGLSSSFTSQYSQLDQYMNDVFNSSIYSGFSQTGVPPYHYFWYENGNLFSNSINASYVFQSSGIYNISLKIVDSDNVSSYSHMYIKVNPKFTLASLGPDITTITGSQSSTFWYNVTGGTWYQNASGFGHYEITFYVNGNGYMASSSNFYNDIGHYSFTFNSFVLQTGANTIKIVAQDGVGQTSSSTFILYYQN